MGKIFRKRPGTTDKGKDYEILNIANIVIDLVRDEDITDFQISSNDEDFGDFDDVVVETQVAESTEIIAIQLKHSDKGTLTLQQLQAVKGDFSINKYFTSWKTGNVIDVDAKFILFTNLKLNFVQDTEFDLDGEKVPITLTQVHPNDHFKILQKTGRCYKFSVVKDENDDKASLYVKFFENFYLCTDQENVVNLKQKVYENFKTFSSGDTIQCDQYLKFLNEWGLREGKKETLDKKWMKLVIALKIFTSRIKPMCFDDFRDTEVDKRNILREAMDSFDITIFKKESYDEVKYLWGDVKSKLDDLTGLNKLIIKYQYAPNYISDFVEIDSVTLNILFWLMGICPLILKPDESVYKILDFCADKKCILLEEACGNSFTENISVFRTLLDLKIKKRDKYDQLVKTFKCSLQGKQEISLETLIAVDEFFLNILITDDLLEIVKDQLNIGEVKEDLADPYVERCLFKNAIKVEVLDNITKDTVVIVDCVSERYKLQLKSNSYNIINIDDYLNAQKDEKIPSKATVCLSETQCQYSELNAVSEKAQYMECLHWIRLSNDGNLEWIRSKGDVSGLEKYKLSEFYYPVQERDLSAPEFRNNVNLLISDPGMGKSELMKSFKNKCFSECFTIIIYPRDVNLFSKNTRNGNNLDAFRDFLLNEKCKRFPKRDFSIFRSFLEKNKIIVLWDAMDELLEQNREIVCDIIVKLSKNSTQWVTSRPQLQNTLQQKFSSLCFHLVKFNEHEQREYIQKRLSEVNPVEKIETILEKIKSSFAIVEQENILGIPLQLFMLTELFRKDEKKYLALLDKVFSLTDLYHYFIQEKFNIFYRDKMRLDLNTPFAESLMQSQNEKLLQEYTNGALRLLFPEAILRKLKVQCEQSSKVVDESHINMRLVTEVRDQIPRFSHNSFAEYLSARYCEDRFKEEQPRGDQSTLEVLLEIMFDPQYVNVKFFFDLLLAGDSKGHIAVLYKDFSFIKNCTDDEILKRTDAGGRSVLHLACSWGPEYKPFHVRRKGNDYDIDSRNFSLSEKFDCYPEAIDSLIKTCDVAKCDEIFKMAPEEYAQKTKCLMAEMKIITRKSIPLDQIVNILYLSTCFGCHNEFAFFFETFQQNFVEPKNRRRAFYNVKDSSGNTLLHLAASMGHLKILQFLLKAGANIKFRARNGVTLVNAASKNGHFKIVEYLVSLGTDINIADKDGDTPLHSASLEGSYDTVKLLVEKGACFNPVNKNGSTPLHLALQNKYFEIVEYLVNRGTDINLADGHGNTPLHSASSKGYYDIVKLLVKKGACFNVINKNGSTPLHLAVHNRHLKIVEYLVSVGTDINLAAEDGNTPLHSASFQGSYDIVKLLVKKGADFNPVNKNGSTALYLASQNGHFNIVEYLVDLGTDINLADTNGNTPLHLASLNGHYDTVKFLAEKGAGFNLGNKEGDTPLNGASEKGHFEVVEYLVKLGTDLNLADKDGNTPLHRASFNGHYDTVKFLAEKGACFNAMNEDGSTPLHLASQKGYLKIVEYLVNLGTDINLANQYGDTPLHSASSNGSYDTVKLLVEKGALFNLLNNKASRPLDIALRHRHFKIVEYLVSVGIDINLADKYGDTPLHTASSDGHYDTVKFLVEQGAGFNLVNKKGSTPLHLAYLEKHFEIVGYLFSVGADINLANKDGNTLLHSAFYDFDYRTLVIYEVVKSLVENGASFNAMNKKGNTPLHLALEIKDFKIVEYLVNIGADVNLADKDGNTPLHSACSCFSLSSLFFYKCQESYKIAKLLVEKGARFNVVNNSGKMPLHLAIRNRHFKIVEYLVSVGIDINLADGDGYTPLHLASFWESYDIVKLLVEKGAGFNVADYRGCTPLNLASRNGHFKIAEYLVSVGTDINLANESGNTPLHRASFGGSYNIVKLLVEKGARFNAVNKDGSTPLHLASQGAYFKVVEYLVNLGTDINLANEYGDTPLHSVCYHSFSYFHDTQKSYIITKFLVEKGACFNPVNRSGSTPLHLASEKGHFEVVEYLVKLGTDLNLADTNGNTPLHRASFGGSYDIVKLLVQKGAGFNVMNKDGSTPLHLASEKGHFNIVDYLANSATDFTQLCSRDAALPR